MKPAATERDPNERTNVMMLTVAISVPSVNTDDQNQKVVDQIDRYETVIQDALDKAIRHDLGLDVLGVGVHVRLD